VCLFAGSPPISQDLEIHPLRTPFEDLGRQPCAPFSTPSWPPRFPSSQVRPRRLLGRKLDRGRGPLLAWLCRVGAGWGRPIGAERSQTPFFGTISFGLQPSGSSSQPSPRRFQTCSLRRPPVGPPHRSPGAQLANEGLHRLSCTSFPSPSSPSRFPTSQVRLPRLRACACMGIMAAHGGLGASGDRAEFVQSVGRAWDAPLSRVLSHRSRGVHILAQLAGWPMR
jgi:hypothetical protein